MIGNVKFKYTEITKLYQMPNVAAVGGHGYNPVNKSYYPMKKPAIFTSVIF